MADQSKVSLKLLIDKTRNKVLEAPPLAATATTKTSEEGGFVKGLVIFMVTDNLVLTPTRPMSSLTKLIDEFGVKGIDNVEERVVQLGMDQGLMLLKESLQSDIVLSKVFLKQHVSATNATSTSKKAKKRKS